MPVQANAEEARQAERRGMWKRVLVPSIVLAVVALFGAWWFIAG